MDLQLKPDNMPSQKPRFLIYLEQELLDKVRMFAKKDRRTMSGFVVMLIEAEIDRREKEQKKAASEDEAADE